MSKIPELDALTGALLGFIAGAYLMAVAASAVFLW